MSKSKIILLIIFIGNFFNSFSDLGMKIKTRGTFIDEKNRKNVLNTILNKPQNLVGDILGLDLEMTARKKEISKMIKALNPADDKSLLEQTAKKLKNLLNHQLFYVHETYIDADTLYNILQANPYIIKLILLTSKKGIKEKVLRFSEENLKYTRGELETAFNMVANWIEYAGANPFLSIDFQKYGQLKENYKDNPILKIMHNIRECIECDISRKEVPQVRKFFEDQVVQAVNKKFPDKNAQINIVDFATGNLFQTFINVNKIAAQGYKNIRLNLIDLEYKDLIYKYKDEQAKKKNFSNSIEIEPNLFKIDTSSWYLGSGKKGLYMRWKNYYGVHTVSDLNLSTIISELIQPLISDTVFNNTFAYFSMWFNNTPVNLEIVIYGDAADYLEDCKNNPLLKGNLLTGIDYFTDTQDIFEDLRKNGLKPGAKVLAFVHDEIDIPNKKSVSRFFFSRGAQNKPLKHFAVDLKTTALTPISSLPNTTQYYLEDVKELFINAKKKGKKINLNVDSLKHLSVSLENLTNYLNII